MGKMYSVLRAMNDFERGEPLTRDGSALRDYELRFNRQVVDLSDEDDEDDEDEDTTECPKCDGEGVDHWNTARHCRRCHGTGRVARKGKARK